MKKILFLFAILFSVLSFSQELSLDYKEYSYAEFFNMIEKEKDSVFTLSNAIIKFDKQTDSIYAGKIMNCISCYKLEREYFRKEKIIIDKALDLYNVQFLMRSLDDSNTVITDFGVGFYNMTFLKRVTLKGTLSIDIKQSTFQKPVVIGDVFNEELLKINTYFNKNINLKTMTFQDIFIDDNHFKSKFSLRFQNFSQPDILTGIFTGIQGNVFGGKNTSIFTKRISYFFLQNNTFNSTISSRVVASDNNTTNIIKNTFIKNTGFFTGNDGQTINLNITENTFNENVELSEIKFPEKTNIDWEQWNGKLYSSAAEMKYDYPLLKKTRDSLINLGKEQFDNWYNNFNFPNHYVTHGQIQHKPSYLDEIKLRYQFYNFYKSVYDLEKANMVYVEIKDLETKRFGYLYSQNPTFKTFFKWRINQFLKVFSGYGTEPERAVIFSMYVILIFALVYLFFPNSWDSHGKNRIIDRYNFFFKYMKLKTGIHEVYLEDQQEELMSYDQFKENITTSKQKVPNFFTATALPLYKWAISGTQFSAGILKRIDIMKGTWSELPKSKQIWKSVLLISAFLIAVFYDIFIKMLNALMLSINTFTTLGFGEIPIKGLPRYLAIIQGFIGWFMLTIFSVSLISQLLN